MRSPFSIGRHTHQKTSVVRIRIFNLVWAYFKIRGDRKIRKLCIGNNERYQIEFAWGYHGDKYEYLHTFTIHRTKRRST